MFLLYNDDQYQSLNHIKNLLLSELARIFGKEVIKNEDCWIRNQPQALCPMLLNTKPSTIILACAELSYWCQVIYQLSHEMCHFAFRQKKSNKHRYDVMSWFEELVCEAFSLYCLKYSTEHWMECPLSSFNPSYGKDISKYLKSELSKHGSKRFGNISTISDLLVYENDKESERDRSSQINERNMLYHEMIKSPEKCQELCNYQNYLVAPNFITINFNKWLSNTHNDLVKLISTMVHF